MDKPLPLEIGEEKPITDEEVLSGAIVRFWQVDKLLRTTKLGRGAVIRALLIAIHDGLTDKQLKSMSDEETHLALAIHEMLTARTLMQAHLIKQQNSKGVNNEQSTESSSGDSESTSSEQNSQSEVG